MKCLLQFGNQLTHENEHEADRRASDPEVEAAEGVCAGSKTDWLSISRAMPARDRAGRSGRGRGGRLSDQDHDHLLDVAEGEIFAYVQAQVINKPHEEEIPNNNDT